MVNAKKSYREIQDELERNLRVKVKEILRLQFVNDGEDNDEIHKKVITDIKPFELEFEQMID